MYFTYSNGWLNWYFSIENLKEQYERFTISDGVTAFCDGEDSKAAIRLC